MEEKPEQMTPSLSSPRHEQSIQTEFDQIFRSARPTTVSSSSNSRLDELTVGKHQKFADFSEQVKTTVFNVKSRKQTFGFVSLRIEQLRISF